MESENMPVRPSLEVELLRRLKARNSQHNEFNMPFLEPDELRKIDVILNASEEHGHTDTVRRRAMGMLADIGLRDEALSFLTTDERSQLASLKAETRTQVEPKKKGTQRSAMSAGEFIVVVSVILSVAGATGLAYADPATMQSSIWVAIWGVLCGGSFIGVTRRRSGDEAGAVTPLESLLVALVWAIAAVATVLLGGEVMTSGWAAFLSFIGAGFIGRAILKIEDGDDWDDWT